MNVTEFSKRVGLSPHTVRYYDKIGLLDDIHRLSNGHRSFSEKDVKWIEFVQRLKDTGMSLEKILEYASLRKKGSKTLLQRKKLLAEHSNNLQYQIALQNQHLKKLYEKIELYQSALEGKISLD
jgi:DNA-binding transcriptional MerR regulator